MIKSIRNSIGAALLALCGFIGFTPEASACTSFLVGKRPQPMVLPSSPITKMTMACLAAFTISPLANTRKAKCVKSLMATRTTI